MIHEKILGEGLYHCLGFSHLNLNFTSLPNRDTRERSQRGKYRVPQTPVRIILLWFSRMFLEGEWPK